jgi:hypothetical protein
VFFKKQITFEFMCQQLRGWWETEIECHSKINSISASFIKQSSQLTTLLDSGRSEKQEKSSSQILDFVKVIYISAQRITNLKIGCLATKTTLRCKVKCSEIIQFRNWIKIANNNKYLFLQFDAERKPNICRKLKN